MTDAISHVSPARDRWNFERLNTGRFRGALRSTNLVRVPVKRTFYDRAQARMARSPAQDGLGARGVRDKFGWVARPAWRVLDGNPPPRLLFYRFNNFANRVTSSCAQIQS